MDSNKQKIQSSGVRYPMFDMEDAIKLVDTVDKKGIGKLDLDTLAQAWGCALSTIRHHINSAKHYGLITRDGDLITNTELAKSVCMPISNEEKIQSIQKAFFSCGLYSDLFDRFKGERIPETSILSNIIHREFEISATGKDIVAKNFINSLKFARLANEQDGVIIIPLNEESPITRTNEPPAVTQKAEEQKPRAPKGEVIFVGNPETQTLNITLPLPDGGVVQLIVSGNLPKKEAERLKKQIDIFVTEE